MPKRREEILGALGSIPALPTAAMRVVSLLKNPEIEIRDIVSTIEFDPSLTSNVLRLANSAYFCGPRQISSLRDAIVRLGMNRVFQLVVTTAIAPMARKPVKGYGLDPGALLEHCVAVGMGTEELCAVTERKAPPEAFTAGLLHDLGKIVLGTFLEVDASEILELAQREAMSFEAAEAELLGIDHPEVGAALLERWNIPQNIVEAVRWHHLPDQCSPGNALLADLVHISDSLCMSTGLGTGAIDGLHYHVAKMAWTRLDLNEKAIEHASEQLVTHFQEIKDTVLALELS